jgi:hypothetical protein
MELSPQLEIYTKEMKLVCKRDIFTPMCISAATTMENSK